MTGLYSKVEYSQDRAADSEFPCTFVRTLFDKCHKHPKEKLSESLSGPEMERPQQDKVQINAREREVDHLLGIDRS